MHRRLDAVERRAAMQLSAIEREIVLAHREAQALHVAVDTSEPGAQREALEAELHRAAEWAQFLVSFPLYEWDLDTLVDFVQEPLQPGEDRDLLALAPKRAPWHVPGNAVQTGPGAMQPVGLVPR